MTGESYTYRELEDQAKLIKDDLLKVKDVAKVEIYGIQTPGNRYPDKPHRSYPIGVLRQLISNGRSTDRIKW